MPPELMFYFGSECIINIGLRPPFHGSFTFHYRTSTLNSIDISMDPPRYNQVLDFIAILEQSDPTAFQSYNYSIQQGIPFNSTRQNH